MNKFWMLPTWTNFGWPPHGQIFDTPTWTNFGRTYMDKFCTPPTWTNFGCPLNGQILDAPTWTNFGCSHMDKFWMPLKWTNFGCRRHLHAVFWKFWPNNRLATSTPRPRVINQPLEILESLRILTIFRSYKKRYGWVPLISACKRAAKHIKKEALISQKTHGVKQISVHKDGRPENVQCRSATGAADPLFLFLNLNHNFYDVTQYVTITGTSGATRKNNR